MAPANAAQQFLDNLGLHARPDYSNHDRPRLRHTADLDALREAALAKGAGSTEYAQWMAVLQNGEDENLPSVEVFNGAIPQSIEAQGAEAQRVAAQAEHHWVMDRIDPQLHYLGWEGVPFSQMTPDQARSLATMQLAEALPHEQPAWIQVLSAIDNSPTSVMSVTWQGDESERLSYTTRSGEEGHSDPYSQWRQATKEQEGIARLQIQDPTAQQWLSAGMSPDGLSYNSADDWTLNASNQGDATNTFTDEE